MRREPQEILLHKLDVNRQLRSGTVTVHNRKPSLSVSTLVRRLGATEVVALPRHGQRQFLRHAFNEEKAGRLRSIAASASFKALSE